jgi:hypothetical protein
MDEVDILEKECGVRPIAFMGPGEWIHDGTRLPYPGGHNQALSGCYSFCAVRDDGSIYHLYIGKAKCIRSRMVGHLLSGMIQNCFDWCNDNDCWFMVAFWLDNNRSIREQKLCDAFHPLFNKQEVA